VLFAQIVELVGLSVPLVPAEKILPIAETVELLVLVVQPRKVPAAQLQKEWAVKLDNGRSAVQAAKMVLPQVLLVTFAILLKTLPRLVVLGIFLAAPAC